MFPEVFQLGVLVLSFSPRLVAPCSQTCISGHLPSCFSGQQSPKSVTFREAALLLETTHLVPVTSQVAAPAQAKNSRARGAQLAPTVSAELHVCTAGHRLSAVT